MNIDESAMQAVIAKAVLESITPEARTELLEGAIKHLLTKPPKTTSYGADRESPLREIFQSQVRTVADQLIREQLSNDPDFKAKVSALWADIVKATFDNEDRRNGMVDKISTAIGDALSRDRY